MRTLKLGVAIAVMALAVVACGSSSGSAAAEVGTPAPALESPRGEAGTDTIAPTIPPVMSPEGSPAV